MHFVNTKSAEDMNHDACNELQNLWEELNAFGFDDLTWLERHVQSVLSMKNHHLEVDDLQVDKMELAKGGTESLFKSVAMCFKSFNTSHTLLDPVLKLKENESDQEGTVEKYLSDSLRYIWTIKDFSKKWNCHKKLLSEPFFLGNKSW
ncbi:hypothetical protein PIB30_016564 [Stylosanthes scabra]|uniref:MATH domain-containing protein n=1 Tax=Stylosanthes scabra TaxID=79078 RepID=A0ABU6S717_9FABA|nr:hypothetical protein [Stylosanthes scabra]